jgi:uncharacterized protein
MVLSGVYCPGFDHGDNRFIRKEKIVFRLFFSFLDFTNLRIEPKPNVMSLFSYAILSLDGGGIRGIIPCSILAEIERRTEKRIAESFDLIAGTSTGGIIAAGLAIKGDDGKPKYPASKLIELYRGEKGKRIFKKPSPLFHKVRTFFNALYTADNMESVLKEQFGDIRLKNACTNVLITAYDTHHKTPFYFKSCLASQSEMEDFDLCDVCRATSAAPTYFPPKLLKYEAISSDDHDGSLSLIDGGVFANNPSVLAYVEAMELWKKDPAYQRQFRMSTSELLLADKEMAALPNSDNFAPPILLISLGSGKTRKTYEYEESKTWGIKWIKPLIDILMQGVSEVTHYQMQHLLPPYKDASGVEHPRYYRFNIDIDSAYSYMDDTSDKTLAQLEQYGRDIIVKYDKEIDEVCHLLKFIAMEREERNITNEMNQHA